MKLIDVFEVGKTYSLCATHDSFGQISTSAKFEGCKGVEGHKYYSFGPGNHIPEKYIKSFYSIQHPSGGKYINVDLKNGISWTIVELNHLRLRCLNK